jgi:peptidoglycan hydrolase-like protein with peptidoglycan-binding domain
MIKTPSMAALAIFVATLPTLAVQRSGTGSSQGTNRRDSRSATKPSSSFVTELTRNAVIEVQEALNKQGFDIGPVNGIWGPKTAKALREFQEKSKLPVSGRLDRRTVAKLGLATDLPAETGSSPFTTGQDGERK